MLTQDKATKLTAGTASVRQTFFKLWMPYLFQRVEFAGKKHTFLPLNRFYKPLGGREYVEYTDCVEGHGVYFTRDPATFPDIWWNIDHDGGRFWLYDDSSNSRLNYFQRYEALIAQTPGVLVK